MSDKKPQGTIIDGNGNAIGMATQTAPPAGMVWFQTSQAEAGEATLNQDGKIIRPGYSRMPGDVYLEVEKTAQVRAAHGLGVVLEDYQPVAHT